MNPAPTPRTDGITFIAQPGMMPPYNTVPAEFARDLERELAAKDAEIERLQMDNHMLTVRATNAEKCADGRLARAERAEAELGVLLKEKQEWSKIYRTNYGHDWEARNNNYSKEGF